MDDEHIETHPKATRGTSHNYLLIAVIDCCGLLEILPAGSIANEGGSHQGCDELVAAASVPQEPAQLIAQATETMSDFGHKRGRWR